MIEQKSRPFVLLLISAACIFIIIWGIRSSAYIINPILLAGIITITVLPLPERLKKRGLPGWLSLVLTILAVVGVMAVVLLLVIVSIGKFSSELPNLAAQTQARQAEESAAIVAPPPPVSGAYPAPVQLSMTIAQITDQIDRAINSQQFSEIATKIIGLVANSVFLLFITMLIFVFMLSAAISLPRPSRLGLDPDSPLLGQATKYTSDVRKYMVVMTIINFLVGLGDAILLYFMGIPFALLWGVLA
jgi:predicted PurR-regulated permease PerM